MSVSQLCSLVSSQCYAVLRHFNINLFSWSFGLEYVMCSPQSGTTASTDENSTITAGLWTRIRHNETTQPKNKKEVGTLYQFEQYPSLVYICFQNKNFSNPFSLSDDNATTSHKTLHVVLFLLRQSRDQYWQNFDMLCTSRVVNRLPGTSLLGEVPLTPMVYSKGKSFESD